jgi:hypothetical protein
VYCFLIVELNNGKKIEIMSEAKTLKKIICMIFGCFYDYILEIVINNNT